MGNESWQMVLPAIIQIPFIAAFIWFAVKMSADYRDDAKNRDSHWMEFLTLERAQRKEAMLQGMQEIKEVTEGMMRMTESMANLTRAVAEHNIGAIERHNTLKDIVNQ